LSCYFRAARLGHGALRLRRFFTMGAQPHTPNGKQ
jgi:hypothetical protein